VAHTKKPCPGCGQIDRYRAADEVCGTCRKKLDRIAAIEAEAVQLRATVAATLNADTKPRGVYVPEKGYGIVYNNRMGESPEYAAVAATFRTMIQALTGPLDRGRADTWHSNGTVPVRSEYSRSEVKSWVETTDDGAKATQVCWLAFGEFAQACYGAGVEDGRDLLAQLAAGEMTVSQVNDRAYELVNRKRRY
jgi:hypothetical protein